ncbi:hypothetical protein NPIL_187821, partial [Nephila pilipes]
MECGLINEDIQCSRISSKNLQSTMIQLNKCRDVVWSRYAKTGKIPKCRQPRSIDSFSKYCNKPSAIAKKGPIRFHNTRRASPKVLVRCTSENYS